MKLCIPLSFFYILVSLKATLCFFCIKAISFVSSVCLQSRGILRGLKLIKKHSFLPLILKRSSMTRGTDTGIVGSTGLLYFTVFPFLLNFLPLSCLLFTLFLRKISKLSFELNLFREHCWVLWLFHSHTRPLPLAHTRLNIH